MSVDVQKAREREPYWHVRKEDIHHGSALEHDPPVASVDVVLRRDYDALADALADAERERDAALTASADEFTWKQEAEARAERAERERDVVCHDGFECDEDCDACSFARENRELRARAERLAEALRRLASPEGFEGAGMIDGDSFAERELRARGRYAEDVLAFDGQQKGTT